MPSPADPHRVESEAALRARVPAPPARLLEKLRPGLDAHARSWIESAGLAVFATPLADGSIDLGARALRPGAMRAAGEASIRVPDVTEARVGRLSQGPVGALFVVPGVEETLRANGVLHAE